MDSRLFERVEPIDYETDCLLMKLEKLDNPSETLEYIGQLLGSVHFDVGGYGYIAKGDVYILLETRPEALKLAKSAVILARDGIETQIMEWKPKIAPFYPHFQILKPSSFCRVGRWVLFPNVNDLLSVGLKDPISNERKS